MVWSPVEQESESWCTLSLRNRYCPNIPPNRTSSTCRDNVFTWKPMFLYTLPLYCLIYSSSNQFLWISFSLPLHQHGRCSWDFLGSILRIYKVHTNWPLVLEVQDLEQIYLTINPYIIIWMCGLVKLFPLFQIQVIARKTLIVLWLSKMLNVDFM